MLILQLKEGEIIQVGDARIAWVRRGRNAKNQIRIAVEADMQVKVNRTKEFLKKELEEQAQPKQRPRRPGGGHRKRQPNQNHAGYTHSNTLTTRSGKEIPVFKKR